MSNDRAEDQRRSPRFAIRLSAEVNHGRRPFTAVTRDLSIGGVCLETDRLFPEGNALQVRLFLVVDDVEDTAHPPLDMRGKVAWTAAGDGKQPSLMGIRFEGLSASQMAGLRRFVRMLQPAG